MKFDAEISTSALCLEPSSLTHFYVFIVGSSCRKVDECNFNGLNSYLYCLVNLTHKPTMKNRLIPAWAIIILLSGCSVSRTERESTGYSLTGTVNGLPDNSVLILKNTITGQVDSIVSRNGRFVFKGMLPDSLSSANFLLRTSDWSDYRFLWIENAAITLLADFKNLRNGQVTGSQAQVENEILQQIESTFQQTSDSLQRLINDPSTNEKLKGEAIVRSSEIEDQKAKAIMEFVEEHPESIVSGHVLDVYGSMWGKEITARLFQNFSDGVKRSIYGKHIFEYITLARELKIGDKAIDFHQNDPDGRSISLSDFKGKFVLLEFWASWCSPCLRENPNLVRIYKAYHDRGFEILAVSWDEKRKPWVDQIASGGLAWPQVSELKGDRNVASLIYGVYSIPDNFLIDPSGTIIARNLRGNDLEKKLQQIFDLKAGL